MTKTTFFTLCFNDDHTIPECSFGNLLFVTKSGGLRLHNKNIMNALIGGWGCGAGFSPTPEPGNRFRLRLRLRCVRACERSCVSARESPSVARARQRNLSVRRRPRQPGGGPN